ncbi:alpha/beta hydrolase [Stieleria sp. JC731]|uniref:alpha/beta hydrolase n=1 Tax=Pirellulaceae TaxID=2691357 RepID=UPI001E2ECB33|nr:alpha/beta hydrolase [Stieleria sp. JC731]MCC9601191.1 alpha/beta hydrolase [Stieleria sp. JC731]
MNKILKTFSFVGLLGGILVSSPSCAQTASHSVEAIQKDIAYDDEHSSQRLDLYRTKSDHPTPAMVFIHGGGWRGGSKAHVPAWLLRLAAEGKMSVVSVEYRFTDVAPHPAQVDDCLRAIQFVRQQASKWNIDPKRIGVTGGSAGGHLSAYVALADDAAKTDSDDPVQTQSSRVQCAISFAGPTDWSLLKTIDHQHPAYRQLIGYKPGTPAEQMDAGKMHDVSPISFVTEDDPPIMQVHGDADDIVPIEHAKNLHQELQSAGVTCELVVIPDANHSVAGASDQVSQRATAFAQSHLLEKRKSAEQ